MLRSREPPISWAAPATGGVKSCISTINHELVKHRTSAIRDWAKAALFSYVESFYNRLRRCHGD